ncbi:MAG: Gfo/Idh/MocA family oxidoreductase [Bryobacteraceae bacterium]
MPSAAKPSRRYFLGALTAASATRVLGANDRVRLGFIGCGLIGLRHIADFKKLPDADLAAVCDAYDSRRHYAVEACGSNPKQHADFRRLLEDKSIDAVVISTPDHWHCLQTLLACAAGKDVYVEKPMTLFVREGRWMTEAAKRFNRIVLVGTQNRSGAHMKEVIPLFKNGELGKIVSVRIGSFRNVMPGFGRPPASDPPPGLDYDMWQGPAPKKPYTLHRSLYHFRWFWDYSGGQMTNLGAHNLDFVHYLLGVKGPVSVSSSGGRFALEDDGETPDTQDAILEYPGFTVVISIREASAGRARGGTEFFGTNGSIQVGRANYETYPDTTIAPERQIPPYSHPPGHPEAPAIKAEPRMRSAKGGQPNGEPIDIHAAHFIDIVKNRKPPIADVESGHQVAAACHLANLSLRLGRQLRWDPEKEEIIGDKEASAHLVRPYRKPWDAELRSLNLS